MKEELVMLPLVVHESECELYLKIIKMMVAFVAIETIAFGAAVVALAIR